MEIRGNKSGAESFNFASYFLPIKPSNNSIAHKVSKNPKIPIRFFINTSLFTIVVNFTTSTY